MIRLVRHTPRSRLSGVPARTARGKTPTARFAQDRDGTSAIEFGMIAAPFLALLFGILEIGMVFFTSALIEDGVSQAARDVRTGEILSAEDSELEFRTIVCNRIHVIADCGLLKVDVRPFDSFRNLDFTPEFDEDGNIDDDAFQFNPGGPGEVVLVRVFYEYPLLGPGTITGLSDMPGNRRLVVSTLAFRNEPYRPGGGA